MQYKNLLSELIMEERHKFIHCQKGKEREAFLKEISNLYKAKLDTSNQVGVYIKDIGLPEPIINKELDENIIFWFHDYYYKYTIILNIIKTIYSQIDKREINKRLNNFLKYINICSNDNDKRLTTIEEVITSLEDSVKVCNSKYIEYLNTGNYNRIDSDYPITFVFLTPLVEILKKDLGIDSYFAILLDCQHQISPSFQMIVNSFMTDSPKNLSIKVICEEQDFINNINSRGQQVYNIYNFNTIQIDSHLKRQRVK